MKTDLVNQISAYLEGRITAENFELSWEDLAQMLNRLGYKVRLELEVA